MLRLAGRDLVGHPLRTAVTVAMVAVCSALVVAVAGLLQSVDTTGRRLAEDAAGSADVEIAAPFGAGTVPAGVAEAAAQVEGVAAAAPTVQATVVLGDERALLVAGDARALTFLPDSLTTTFGAGAAGGPAAGEGGAAEPQPDVPGAGSGEPAGPDAAAAGEGAAGRVVVGGELARALGVGAGDEVAVGGPSGRHEVVVAGVLPGGAVTGNLVVTDMATGLRLRGGPAEPDRVLVALDDGAGADRRRARARLERALDGRAVLLDPGQRADDATDALQPLMQPLTLLAGLTVTVAGVLVFNVVSVSVAERRRHLAIQRALGARRRRLWASLVGEAVLLGTVGGGVGAALGRRLTAALIDQVPPALANAVLPTRIAVDVPAWVLAAGVAVGAAAAGVAAAVAAIPAMRLSPVEAMGPRDVVGEAAVPVRPLPTALGAGCVAAGTVVLAVAPLSLQVPAALIVLDGIVVLVWALRQPLATALARLARRAGPPGVLAGLAVERSPARNATTVLGALLPVAAVVTLGGLQVNVYDTAHRSVSSLSGADLYVSAQPLSEVGDDRLVPNGLDDEIAAVDGVASVLRGTFTFVRLRGSETLIQGIEPGTTAPLAHLASPAARRRLHRSDAAIVSGSLATRLGLDRGDSFTLPTVAGARRVRVADIVDMTGWPGGFLAVSRERLAAWSGRDTATFLEVRLDEPGAAGAVAAAVERRSPRSGGDLFVTSGEDSVGEAVLSIRQSQALFTALQAVLMAAGAFAIVSTLIVSTIGRTRELGLIRAVGARRRLLLRSVVVEAFVVTVTGAALGVGIGLVFQFVAVRLASRAAGFAADFALAPRPTLTALVAGVAVATTAAAAALRRVLRLDVLEAIAYE